MTDNKKIFDIKIVTRDEFKEMYPDKSNSSMDWMMGDKWPNELFKDKYEILKMIPKLYDDERK